MTENHYINNYIYLDWNSYGLLYPPLSDRMIYIAQNFCNPASKHRLGQASKRLLLDLTTQLLSFMDADGYDVAYMPSATTANREVSELYDKLYVSDIEHPSLRDSCKAEIIKVNPNAELDISFLQSVDQSKKFLVSYMLANHETGIINDIKKVGDSVRAAGGILHTDMTQAFGRIDISLKELSPDYVTIASHKSGGPIGIGALLYKKGLKPPSKTLGTVPLYLIAGLVDSYVIPRFNNSALEALLDPKLIVGYNLPRLPNTTCIMCTNKSIMMVKLDRMGIMCSTGAACTSEISDRAHTPHAMGIDIDTIRISSGWSNTEQDLIKAGEAIAKIES